MHQMLKYTPVIRTQVMARQDKTNGYTKMENLNTYFILFYKSYEQITPNFCDNLTNYKTQKPQLANKPSTQPHRHYA